MKKILAFFILNLIILIHELGHLVGAWTFNIPVKQLSLGFGPSFFQTWLPGGLEFNLRIVPLGAFVELAPDIFSYPNITAIIISALGPGFNFLLSITLSYLLIAKLHSSLIFFRDSNQNLLCQWRGSIYRLSTNGQHFEAVSPPVDLLQITVPWSRFKWLPFQYLIPHFISRPKLNLLSIYFQHPTIKEYQTANTKSIQGPISIFKELALFLTTGWEWGALGTANISLSLGIFNLLPLLIFDGGKIFSHLIGLLFNVSIMSANLSLAIIVTLFLGIFFTFKLKS